MSRERFQDSNALAEISRRLREQATAAAAGTSGRETEERRRQEVGGGRRAAPAAPILAVAQPAPARAPQPPARKRHPLPPAPPPPPPPAAPWNEGDTVAFVDTHLSPAIEGRAPAGAAALQAALSSLLASPRPLGAPLRAALGRGVDDLDRATPASLPSIAAIVAADLLATGGPPRRPPIPPLPTEDPLAAHKAAFAASIEAVRKGGTDPGLDMALAVLVGGVEEGE